MLDPTRSRNVYFPLTAVFSGLFIVTIVLSAIFILWTAMVPLTEPIAMSHSRMNEMLKLACQRFGIIFLA